MIVNRHSWHYILMRRTYGSRVEEKYFTLCKYFRRLVLAIFVSGISHCLEIFWFLFRLPAYLWTYISNKRGVDYETQELVSPIVLYLFYWALFSAATATIELRSDEPIMLLSLGGLVALIAFTLTFLLAFVVLTVSLYFAFGGAKTLIKATRDKLNSSKEQEDPLVVSWLEAKHKKICPKIEFVNADTENGVTKA